MFLKSIQNGMQRTALGKYTENSMQSTCKIQFTVYLREVPRGRHIVFSKY